MSGNEVCIQYPHIHLLNSKLKYFLVKAWLLLLSILVLIADDIYHLGKLEYTC